MSYRNNDVFNVLTTSGNLALLAAGSQEDALAVGQLGMFDANTGLSITAAIPRQFYFALGINADGNVRKSAGQYIPRNGLVSLSYKAHGAGQPMIVAITDLSARCEQDYTVRIGMYNARIGRIMGNQAQFTKAFSVRGACCEGCADDCTEANPNDIALKLVKEINLNSGGTLIATLYNTTLNVDVTATITNAATLAAYQLANLLTVLSVRIQSVPVPVSTSSSVNLHFYKFHQTTIHVALVEGFGCSGIVTILQDPIEEEGLGANIRQLEYMATAWYGLNAGPYVLQSVPGIAVEGDYTALINGVYDQFILEYNYFAESGWLEYMGPLSTIFAVPSADVVTRASLATILDLIGAVNAWEALSDDAAAANVNPAVAEIIIADVLKDGLA